MVFEHSLYSWNKVVFEYCKCVYQPLIFLFYLFYSLFYFVLKATDYLSSDYKTVNISIFRTSRTNSSEIDLTAMYDTITP